MKDDSGSYAVFKEQGSSASQMTAAKVMDVMARLPECPGQAADASAYTQVKNGGRPYITETSKVRVSRMCGYVFHDTSGQNHGSTSKTQWFLLSEICTDTAGLLWERRLDRVLLGLGWETVPNWECSFVHRKQGLFLSVYVDDFKMTGRTQNLNPVWKKLMKLIDLGELTSLLERKHD